MGVSEGFFKAKSREVAESEITSRLGGESETTEFLTNYILNIAKGDSRMKKFPMAVFVHETKPQFSLSDGEMLDGYAVDVSAKKQIGSKYMGSSDTVYLHQKEQLSEGMTTPSNIIAIFITRIPSGSKLAWTVDVVGKLQKKVESKVDIISSADDVVKELIKKVFSDYPQNSFSWQKSEKHFSIEFYRKVNPVQFNDVEYYLGELDSKQNLNDASWSYVIAKREDGILVKFETTETDLSLSLLRKVEYKIAEIDSDLRRVKRSKS
jgi:hypothetical protein